MSDPLTGLLPPVAQRAALCVYVGQLVGLTPQVTSGYRSLAAQATLRAHYEACLSAGELVSPSNPDARCRYPANRPGDSAHNWGLAWDSWVPDLQWDLWTAIRVAAGFVVPANDRVHAEVPDWRAVRDWLIQAGYYPNSPAPAAAVASSSPASAPTRPSATPTPPPAPIGPQAGAQRPRDFTSAPPGSWMCAQEVKQHPGYDVWCAGVKQG